MRKARSLLVPFLLFAVLSASGLAACGDDDEEEEEGQAPATTAPVQGSDVVSVEMVDFAYRVSGPLTEGGTLRISNVGQEFHMMGMGRLKPGKTLQDVTTALEQAGPGGGEGGPTTSAGGAGTTTSAAGGATTTTTSGTTTSAPSQGAEGEEQDPFAEILDEVGLPGNFMSPGSSADVRVPDFGPGSYVLVCFIPTEVEGTPHFAKGMIGELAVVEGTPPPEPAADVTYRLAPGQPVQGPTTLRPGRQTLKFEAAPGSEDLEPGIARLNPGTTFAELDAAAGRLFESEEPPPRGAAGLIPGQIVYSGFDLHGVSTFYLTVDLTPGNYVIVAEDTDAEDRPRPPREMISITVS